LSKKLEEVEMRTLLAGGETCSRRVRLGACRTLAD
jgi:hypothetical protein